MRAASMIDIGTFNEKVVLHTIRSAGEEIGQSEVVRRSRLSRQAVSQITRRLQAAGLIEVAGRRITGPGKPHTLLRVVPDSRLAVGVHLDPAHVSVAICDLAGAPLAKSRIGAPMTDPADDVDRIADEISALAGSIGAVHPAAAPAGGGQSIRRQLLGIGIAAPAPLDAVAGVVREPPWIPGWRGVPVVEAVQEATALPALLDKDTNAALTGEIWSRHLSTDETILFLYVGHGVGSAVSSGGRVHRGGTTQAGEIGHLPTGLPGPVCSCGRTGCLSLFTDARTIIEQARTDGVGMAEGTEVREALGILSAAAAEGDSGARAALTRHGSALGEALSILAGIHDPQRIIIGGPAWPALEASALPLARRPLRGWLEEQGAVLESSHVGDDVGALGAASLFLEQELAPGRGIATSMRAPARSGATGPH